MDNTKDNRYYLDRILTDLRFIIAHTQDLDQEDLEENEVLQDSVMFRLIAMRPALTVEQVPRVRIVLKFCLLIPTFSASSICRSSCSAIISLILMLSIFICSPPFRAS